MRICILTTALSHGGASVVAFDVAKGMAQRGHQVLFVCSGKFAASYEQDGYRLAVLSQKRSNPFFHYLNPYLLWKLNSLLSEFKPDVIHVHNINLQTFSLCTLLYSRQYPMVWTLHDLWALCVGGWPQPFDCTGVLDQCHSCVTWPSPLARSNKVIKELVYRYSKLRVVCPSVWSASLIRNSLLNRYPIYVIHNGIELRFSAIHDRSTVAQSLKLPPGKKILLFCGGRRTGRRSPGERKGWKQLAAALETLSQYRDDIHLLYVGDALDLPPSFPVSVTFTDGVDREDMRYFYGVADIFVLPTLADNSPMTVLESMACKVPVISTEVGGIPEAVIPGETGILCPPGDANALAGAIEWLLSNPEQGAEMAERGYRLILDEFSFEQMIDGYETVYHETVANAGTM